MIKIQRGRPGMISVISYRARREMDYRSVGRSLADPARHYYYTGTRARDPPSYIYGGCT